MVVFTFVNSQKNGGYYIASSKDSMGWQGIPQDLASVVEDARRKGEEVEEVSIGLDGDWFLRTNARHACKTQHVSPEMVSNVELFAQLAKQGGLNIEQYAIQVFTFVPDSSGYVTVLHKGDRSLTRCAWHNVPAGLDQLLEREAANGVRHVTVGMNGSYVVILNSGVVWWKGVPPALNRLLNEAEKTRRGVKTVSLSLVAADWFFVEFADGATQFVMPPQWHATINKHTSLSVRRPGPTMVTSFASSPSPTVSGFRSISSPSPQTSRHGSLSSFSPLSPHTPSPVLGYQPYQVQTAYQAPAPQTYQAPYTPNPYVQSFAGMQQFVPQPPPLQQQYQPVNVTNVYNTIQEPQKPSNNSSGTVQLLGGALKVAGALLPLFTGNLNNGGNGGSFF